MTKLISYDFFFWGGGGVPFRGAGFLACFCADNQQAFEFWQGSIFLISFLWFRFGASFQLAMHTDLPTTTGAFMELWSIYLV